MGLSNFSRRSPYIWIYGIAILREHTLPNYFAFTFLAFAILLAGYVVLLTFGPSPKLAEGLRIQVAGQKITVYASVFTVLIQAVIAGRLLDHSVRMPRRKVA